MHDSHGCEAIRLKRAPTRAHWEAYVESGDKAPSNVRYGSLADVTPPGADVRLSTGELNAAWPSMSSTMSDGR